MSDNIVKFPKPKLPPEFFIEVDLEDSRDDMAMVNAVTTMLEMNVNGIYMSSDVEWHHIMDAAISIMIRAGLRAGIDRQEIENILADIKVEDEDDI
jgi:hypothetical protein